MLGCSGKHRSALYLAVPGFLLIIIVYNTIFILGDCRISMIKKKGGGGNKTDKYCVHAFKC